MSDRICCNCIYWDQLPEKNPLFGFCMHGPPCMNAEGWADFPKTYEDDYCYQFKKQEET